MNSTFERNGEKSTVEWYTPPYIIEALGGWWSFDLDPASPEKLSFKGFESFERAYCSLLDSEIDIKLLWSGFRQAKSLEEPTIQQGNKKLNEKRIHPTQKPVLLYKRLLLDYAKPGWRILDTHGGSMSLAIACFDLGYEVVIIEKDPDYFADGRDRLINRIKNKQ